LPEESLEQPGSIVRDKRAAEMTTQFLSIACFGLQRLMVMLHLPIFCEYRKVRDYIPFPKKCMGKLEQEIYGEQNHRLPANRREDGRI
jgi:hypothetical protein